MSDPYSDYEPRWGEIRCPRCLKNGWITAEAYGDHLLACGEVAGWNLTEDDKVFLKVNKIDPEVE